MKVAPQFSNNHTSNLNDMKLRPTMNATMTNAIARMDAMAPPPNVTANHPPVRRAGCSSSCAEAVADAINGGESGAKNGCGIWVGIGLLF